MSAGAVAASAAAAAKLRRERQEEEELTPYTHKDLEEDWEFKILRSATGKFRNGAWLQSVLDEEARAGWQLVEKFDDARVRLKRPASARARDATLGFDAYRTWAGISQTRYAIVVLLLIFGFIGLVTVLFAVVSGSTGGR
jgi:hypothetical protein